MVIKVYISGISGNKEVKKRQQRVQLILDSKNVKYEVLDIAEPGAEETKDFMQNKSTGLGATIGDPNPRHALPPQIFNDDEYCGDYDMFDMANEIDEMEKFLKLSPNSLNEQVATAEVNLKNGDLSIDEKIDKVAGKIEDETDKDASNEQIKETEEDAKETEEDAKETEEDAKETEEDAKEKDSENVEDSEKPETAHNEEEKKETESEKKEGNESENKEEAAPEKIEDGNAGGDQVEDEAEEKDKTEDKADTMEKEASPEKSEE